MKSKKRTIGIIIVVIVVLLGFASSLLIYKNKLSSDNINNDLNKENVLKNYFYVTEEENIVYDSINHIKYVNNELEIVAENGTDMNDIHELAKKYNAEIVGEIEILNTYQFKFNENFTLSQLEEIITDIKESSFVLDANINYVWDNFYNTYEINKGDIWKNETWNEEIPDGKNWGIEAIQCISAWGLLNKESINPVRIGIIDNVFDENHEDLGFAKTYYNCSQSELLKYVSENDSYEHGTNVAGVMAANSRLDSHGSDLGICGVYPFGYENLYGVSFIGASKTNIAIESYLVTLIVENNVKVINISCLGNVNLTFRASHLNEDSAKDEFKKASLPIEEKLIELIRLKYDFLICTSAGNESYGWFKENKDGEYEQIRDKWDVFGATKTDIIDAKYGPLFATIDNEELKKRIVVVGAIEQEKNHMQICSYSNGGKRVDIYAPGEKITTTSVDNKYCYYFKGTSAAAPFVSGTAAMVWSVNNNLTGEEVKEILCNTAKCPENSGSEYFKMVNAKLAVEEAIRRKDTLVVPIEDETQLTEFVEITEIPTESALQISAIDLIDKTIPEIIALMNGEYQIIKTENDGYIYIQNQSVLPGMEFYIRVSGDDIIPANNGEEIHSDTLKAKLESGELILDGIQVNKSGKVSDSIQADMDYKSCSKVLGEFNCVSGTGAYLSGAPCATAYTYNENNAEIILYFDINAENDLNLGKITSFSSEEMMSYNPHLMNVVIRKTDTVTTVQTEHKDNNIEIVPSGRISYYGEHRGAITNNGDLYIWGNNSDGQLGTVTDEFIKVRWDKNGISSSPIKIMENVACASLGYDTSAAITNDGSLYTWGCGRYGRLGNGDDNNSTEPVKIMDNAVSVSLGFESGAAITNDSSLFVWGYNLYGLGNGNSGPVKSPVKVMDNVKRVKLGGDNGAIITNDDVLYIWGSNIWGQLGNGKTTDNMKSPVKVMEKVKDISFGNYYYAILSDSGEVYICGQIATDKGVIGTASTPYKLEISQKVKEISCYGNTIYFIGEDDFLYEMEKYNSPVKIMENVDCISSNVAITKDGCMYTWGSNEYGQLGNGTTEDSEEPIKIMDNVTLSEN